ncbi:MAG: 8-oxo-dGTP diphosphatase [Candidatus Portnoybacteria bacterium]|nr:8-oxo-dGTP diphosphatase [Candidatus Portnoybacteria bacterium]
MRQVSLVLLIKENQKKKKILLAMKKRGFGKGRWNGVGGKIDLEKGDKSVLCSAIRETEEEIGVKINNPERVAVMDFHFPEVPKEKDFDQQVHVFLVKDWEGEPIETEEMAPKWFNLDKIPFDQMWDDDKHWLPHVLEEKKLKAKFVFDKEEKIADQNIEVVEGF